MYASVYVMYMCFCARVHVCRTLSGLPGMVPEPLLRQEGPWLILKSSMCSWSVGRGERVGPCAQPPSLDSASAMAPSGEANWVES